MRGEQLSFTGAPPGGEAGDLLRQEKGSGDKMPCAAETEGDIPGKWQAIMSFIASSRDYDQGDAEVKLLEFR